MIVRKYTGSNETEAVMKAKEDLGSGAVVLNVKNMKQRGLARLFKKDYVEITAALEEKDFSQENRNAAFARAAEEAIKRQQSKIDLKADDSTPVKDGKASEAIEKKLDSLHDMIKNQMAKEEEEDGKTGSPSQDEKEQSINFKSLRLIYNKMIENEVDEKYANSIINDIESSLKKESNLDSILASVYQKIILKLGEPECIEDNGRRKIVFFIGPTGVGKTTTIAKLASKFKLNDEKKVAMVTADTYRIAAVEQLNTYAGILDVPVNVVYTPEEMKEAVEKLEDFNMIFVDTAGRSHKNEKQHDEVVDLINSVRDIDGEFDTEIFLVLSATTKYRDIMSICDAYRDIDGYRLLFTKLDETVSRGNILNTRIYTGAPLSYTTSGQNVPYDIEKTDVQRLAKSILGGDN